MLKKIDTELYLLFGHNNHLFNWLAGGCLLVGTCLGLFYIGYAIIELHFY
jgi:hypothetical protein